MIRRMVVATGLTLALLLGVWVLLGGQAPAVKAAGGVFYVATDGNDGRTCASVAQRCRTIQRALDAAEPMDEIRVAGGTYGGGTGKVIIAKTATLLGGWAPGFALRDPLLYPTTLDAEGTGRVMTIGQGISPTIDGFVLTGGNATHEPTGAGKGGGIYSEASSPIIRNNVIMLNTSSISPTSGSGGGIYVQGASASAVISGNRVLSNTCHTKRWDDGGGGLYLERSDLLVQGNLVAGNTSDRVGGGLHIGWDGAPRIVGNEIRANEAQHNGGGIYANCTSWPRIEGNLIAGNRAGYYAGGILLSNGPEATVDGNQIVDNRSNICGGLLLESYKPYTVTNNVIARNEGGGIRIWDTTRTGLVAHNTVVYNTGTDGGIIVAEPHITPTVVNNIVAFNSWGIRADSDAAGTLDYNDVWSNTEGDYDLPGALEPGVHDLQAAPRFVNGSAGNYHLKPDSPCVDRGMDAGVTVDMDGHRRPIGAGYDIGADEWMSIRVFVPLVRRR
ncbi:MAG: right-handed parallel beta-helix repeat-containing protein [Anaerolineae bacterium]|nr:right-handed parallel beta-helix repeat-containing protein [Anaerolineae bacterium]